MGQKGWWQVNQPAPVRKYQPDATDHLDIAVADGKYRVVLTKDFRLHTYRHGEFWFDETGSNFILALAQEIETRRSGDSPLVKAAKEQIRLCDLVTMQAHLAIARAEVKRLLSPEAQVRICIPCRMDDTDVVLAEAFDDLEKLIKKFLP
jgi:hypothetical protein